MLPGMPTLTRAVRTHGGRVLARAGILPGGVPDRLGDDARLQDRGIQGEVAVFFPDTRENLYQIRQWYGPLEHLHRAQGVTIICMDSKVARVIRTETRVPVITIARDSFLDELINRSQVKLFLYVNYTPLVFLALRLRSVIHVSLLHGDSDKSVSVSNQVKAFDVSLVAGQAAIDRYERYTALFDAQAHCIAIGRPNLDTEPAPERPASPTSRTALYAPTWEGGQESVAYGSLDTHGEAIVRSLAAAGFTVIYRPHPLTGARIGAYGEADVAVRAAVAEHEPSRVSESTTALTDDFAAADVLVTDISSVATEWLATGRPMIITRPASAHTHEARTRLLEVVPRLAAADAEGVGEIALREVDEDPTASARLALREYYLGDTAPGASLARFLQTCRELTALRDREWTRIRAEETGDAERTENS